MRTSIKSQINSQRFFLPLFPAAPDSSQQTSRGNFDAQRSPRCLVPPFFITSFLVPECPIITYDVLWHATLTQLPLRRIFGKIIQNNAK
jgi:hypothetical protein